MDKATGEPFLQNGEQITSEVTFVPEAPSGSVEVLFAFDSKLIKTDTNIVVFESLYSDSKELTVHADIKDDEQTVTVIVPEIKTEASIDGKKETTIGGEITIEDIVDLAGQSTSVLEGSFAVSAQVTFGLLNLLCLIAFAYCVIKIFFQNIKRGGILLVQMAVGSLYMFSVPRGYTDGFNQWCKQVAAICLTAFMQTTLLFLGLLTFPDHMLLGLGIMLAANEVPRIAQHSGLQKGNYRKIKGLSALFTRIKRKYVTDKSYKKATIHNA